MVMGMVVLVVVMQYGRLLRLCVAWDSIGADFDGLLDIAPRRP